MSRVARISDAVGCRLQQAQLAIERTEQHHPGIAGHAATVKAAFYDASSKTPKFDLVGFKFFGTVWHWRTSVEIGIRYP